LKRIRTLAAKNDVISFSRKRYCALGLESELGLGLKLGLGLGLRLELAKIRLNKFLVKRPFG